ncbi:MAG: 1-acyl-sn-glycerol-3-phosphate acyltransferase [Phycisphaerales bacterium]|nr:1-acyl-sn-glycerol-3-phosphate acyltransferase [Phycisphaerales bacterium]
MIVVCNHTAGVDPILVQSACPFFIRWVMAQDMRDSRLEWFWTWWDVIFVDRTRPDSVSIRAALRHLKRGGVIGIFPEGGLERPPQQILPFQHGVGMLIKKSQARVLTVTIHGTPQVDPAWASLWHASRSIVHFRELIDYDKQPRSAGEIADDLRRRFVNYTSWPVNNTMPGIDELPGSGKKGRPVPAH